MKTVLIVEDDEGIRELVSAALDSAGYRVIAAGHGVEALDLLDREASLPDTIILDWMMPVMNGPELLARLAADPARAAIPVLVMSACDRPLKTVGLPVAVVLTKPVRMRTLIETVDKLSGQPWRPSPFVTGRFPAIPASSGREAIKTVVMRPGKPPTGGDGRR